MQSKDRWYPLPPALLAVACLAIGGFQGLVWGFVISTVALWHTTYAINSICHSSPVGLMVSSVSDR